MNESDLLIGKLLVKKGYINNQQLVKALDYQTNLDRKKWMPIGEILIRMQFINKQSLDEVLKEQAELKNKFNIPKSALLTRATQKQDEITQPKAQMNSFKITNLGKPPTNKPIEEVKELSQPQTNKFNPLMQASTGMTNLPQPTLGKPPVPLNTPNQNIHNLMPPKPPVSNFGDRKPIGEILVDKGYITKPELSKALQYQAVLPPVNYKPIGEILIDLKLINRFQLEDALNAQKPKNENSLVEILKKLGFIKDPQLALMLTQQHSIAGKPVLIGDLLVEHGFISKEQLEIALREQKKLESQGL